ncbi:MAG: GreA/GreB family elongation factor, partial [Candidatus Hinthialibacter sp.]
DRVMDHTRIRIDRPLPEAVAEIDLFMNFLPGAYLRHPDWGIGRVTDLDMTTRRAVINFQRKRDHGMDVELAQKAVEPLDENDFRVQRVINREGLIQRLREEPLDFIKSMLKSFGGSMTAKEIKENLVPGVINVREWTTWWSKTNSAMRRDPFIAVSGGSAKRYTLRTQAASDEEELLKRFDETKAPHSKVDLIYEYLRTTKKSDVHEQVILHFSKKLHAITPRRRSATERVELWYANEALKEYVDKVESMPLDIIDAVLSNTDKFVRVMQRLRFKAHQWQYAHRFQIVCADRWAEIFQRLLLEPVVMIRDELAEALKEGGEIVRVKAVIEQTVSEFRQFPHTFIWLAGRVLIHDEDWLDGKISKSTAIERLLLLVDYLTSQAKRREKEDAAWLRKVAGDARDLIRRDRYRLFKKFIQEADEGGAQSIYRRAQTNEGLDARTSADLTTIVRARFPNLFSISTAEESPIPEGLLCLHESYRRKQELFKRLVSQDLPEVVQEIEIARQQGDLRENAEYHAARDKQKLLAAQTAELEESLHRAKAVDLSALTLERVEFGVLFKISPSGSDIQEDYVMLGPWESNPDKRVLSYQAPFAMAFMGKKKGDFVELEMPTLTGRYEIVSIEAIPPERLQEIINDEIKKIEQDGENISIEEASVSG